MILIACLPKFLKSTYFEKYFFSKVFFKSTLVEVLKKKNCWETIFVWLINLKNNSEQILVFDQVFKKYF